MGISTCEKADDSEHLILECFDLVHNSLSHLYHSALPLSPSSWVRECYKAEVAGEVRVLMGLPDQWDPCSRTIPLRSPASAFAYRGDTIAVAFGSNVELLDAISGARTSALRGHTDTIWSITFSLDGALLVSISKDRTVKLWDMQTGGLVRAFSDNAYVVSAVSISPDSTTIALGIVDGSIGLWDVRTGNYFPITKKHPGHAVTVISFSPTDSQRLISSSEQGLVQQLDVDGHHVATLCHHHCRVDGLAYALDGTCVISCGGTSANISDTKSGAVAVRLRVSDGLTLLSKCCFSPNGEFVACGGGRTVYVWNITASGARLVESLVGHSDAITFVAFPSFLVSGSRDQSVKFWKSSSFLAKPKTTDHVAALPLRGPTHIASFNLFAKDNTVVTSNQSGLVKTWDLMTGKCKSSFSTPAQGPRDTHLEGDALIIVWRTNRQNQHQYHVWDVYNGQLLRTLCTPSCPILHLKISGDGAKVFGLGLSHIEAVSMQTGDICTVELEGKRTSNFFAHGFKVGNGNLCGMGWDFGASEVPSFGEFPDRPRLDFVDWSGGSGFKPRWIEDTITKRLVFRLPESCTKSGAEIDWDGRYLLVWYQSGEVVIMDFDSVRRALDRIH